MFGDRHGDAGDVSFLKRVGADHRPPDLAGDSHHRDRVHLRIGERGDQVGGTRPRCRHAYAYSAGHMRITASRVTCPLLVAHQHMAQLVRVEQRVVDRQYGASRNPEDHVDAELL